MTSSNFYTVGPRRGQIKDKRDWDDKEWLGRASRIDNLNSVMKMHKLSQSALARKIGVNQSTVSRWLKSQTRPHKQAMRDLAHLWKSCGYSLDV